MSDIYDKNPGMLNKLLDDDGSIITLSGDIVDMSTATEEYKNSAPIVNKLREPDGSISKITDYMGGGGGEGGITEIVSTNNTLLVSGGKKKKYIDVNNDMFISSLVNDITFDSEFTPTSSSTTIEVNNETELVNAINNASDYDTIKLTNNIVITNTLVINKKIKLDGEYTIETAGTASDPVTMINITADGVVITDKVTIKHKKTNNTSVECAIRIDKALGVIINATVEFMEIGYNISGSFKIGGKVSYKGVANNSNRAVVISNLYDNSVFDGLEWDFVNNATPVSNFIVVGYNALAGTAGIDACLMLKNCKQVNTNRIGRQFLFFEGLYKTVGTKPSIIVEDCLLNCANGDIGVNLTGTLDLSFFEFIALINNTSLNAAYLANSYKGLFFCDGSGSVRSLGSTTLYVTGNKNSRINRSADDYTSAIGNSVVGYKNTLFNNDVPLKKSYSTDVKNSIYNYISEIDDKLDKVYTDESLSGDGTINNPLKSLSAPDNWTVVDEDNVDIEKNKNYIAVKNTGTQFALPTSSDVGDTFAILLNTDSECVITQKENQVIHIGDTSSTTGLPGFVKLKNRLDIARFVCIIKDKEWATTYCIGNLLIN